MDYLTGFAIFFTLLLSIIIHRKINRRIANVSFAPLTQSESYERIKHLFKSDIKEKSMPETQLSKYIKSNTVRVIIENDTAYWVSDNTFYTANVVDGMIDQESTQPINTDSMSKDELDKMLFILDHLKG